MPGQHSYDLTVGWAFIVGLTIDDLWSSPRSSTRSHPFELVTCEDTWVLYGPRRGRYQLYTRAGKRQDCLTAAGRHTPDAHYLLSIVLALPIRRWLEGLAVTRSFIQAILRMRRCGGLGLDAVEGPPWMTGPAIGGGEPSDTAPRNTLRTPEP